LGGLGQHPQGRCPERGAAGGTRGQVRRLTGIFGPRPVRRPRGAGAGATECVRQGTGRIPSVNNRQLQLSLALALALGAGSAHALGLGQIEVKSRLNEPLVAEIPIVSAAPGELDELQVRLASPEAFARVGLERPVGLRSEEHTSELQSRENLVCRLLLEKKNELHS